MLPRALQRWHRGLGRSRSQMAGEEGGEADWVERGQSGR